MVVSGRASHGDRVRLRLMSTVDEAEAFDLLFPTRGIPEPDGQGVRLDHYRLEADGTDGGEASLCMGKQLTP